MLTVRASRERPNEKWGASLKTLRRTTKARTIRALAAAITAALPQITAHDAHAWFRHSGTRLQQV